jgi:hypothetical protein
MRSEPSRAIRTLDRDGAPAGGEHGDGEGDSDDSATDDDAASAVFALPPGADPAIDWGLRAHLHPDGSPRIIERHLVVPPELAGLRLDHFVKTQIPRLSRTRIQGIITDQLRRADGHAPKPATIVAAGDHYVLRRAARPEPPCPRHVTAIVVDPRLYVVDKPAGLPVHASAKFYFNTLTRVLAERFPGEPELQICHRLDRETSGCLTACASSTSRWCTASRRGTTSTRSTWRSGSRSPAIRPGSFTCACSPGQAACRRSRASRSSGGAARTRWSAARW